MQMIWCVDSNNDCTDNSKETYLSLKTGNTGGACMCLSPSKYGFLRITNNKLLVASYSIQN